MWKYLRIISLFIGPIKKLIKKHYDKKVLNLAMDEGEKTVEIVNQKFGGPLSKENYQDQDGNWVKPAGEELYEKDKWERKKLWTNTVKRILVAAYPQYNAYTALLDIVLGRLFLKKKFE